MSKLIFRKGTVIWYHYRKGSCDDKKYSLVYYVDEVQIMKGKKSEADIALDVAKGKENKHSKTTVKTYRTGAL